MTKDGTALALDSAQLLSSIAALLPIPIADSQARAALGQCLRGKDVMVVDDEVYVAEFVHDVLTRHGAQVQIANCGLEAYEKMRSKHFDLIVCDHHMPGLDGQSLYRLVESGDPSASERFLFVTGDLLALDTRQFDAQNGVHFLRKPFRIQELLEAVERLFNRNSQPGC